MSVATIHEPAREVPVIHEADICVLGGSCTGVFAAIRAARLGASVVLVEKAGCFGGVATLSLVNVWHSPLDTEFKRPIIGGLTLETMQRLQRRGCVTQRECSPAWAWAFNAQELQIELDEMVREAGVKPYLHTAFVAPHVESDELRAVIVENKSGRGAIRARYFIDATGDGDLCARLGLPVYFANHLQPSTTCAVFSGWDSLEGYDVNRLIQEHRDEYDLPEGFAWGVKVPGSDNYMLAGTRIYGANCADGEALTEAEMEGRRQVRAVMDIIRRYIPEQKIALQALPSRLGIRETRHVKCRYQLTGEDVLTGRRFDDAIANGSYRVDIHHQDKPGITFRYLDGTQEYVRPGVGSERGRWREETAENPTFYQIPYRSLLPGSYPNLLVAGRMIDADMQAHAAIRVMVNMNQTGEAAGVAAWLASCEQGSVAEVEVSRLRTVLAEGGSTII